MTLQAISGEDLTNHNITLVLLDLEGLVVNIDN